jgi:plasmid stabilization system protein ParE
MQYKLVIKADALEDMAEAIRYYEEQAPGLGQLFLDELIYYFDKIETTPTHYGFSDEVAGKIFRDVLMRKFPYKLFFELAGNEVTIYAVIHAQRDPDFIKMRAEKR